MLNAYFYFHFTLKKVKTRYQLTKIQLFVTFKIIGIFNEGLTQLKN